MTKHIQEQIEIIKRGCNELLVEEELKQRLSTGLPLRIKAGFDPTAPDLHLGHIVLLNKMRQLQDHIGIPGQRLFLDTAAFDASTQETDLGRPRRQLAFRCHGGHRNR